MIGASRRHATIRSPRYIAARRQPLRSPDGTRVLSGTVKLWDAATGALIRTLEEHSDLVLSVSWTFICAPLLEEGSVRSRGHNGARTEDADRGTGEPNELVGGAADVVKRGLACREHDEPRMAEAVIGTSPPMAPSPGTTRASRDSTCRVPAFSQSGSC